MPLLQTTASIVAPGRNFPIAMAAYLDSQVSRAALIETWEPELGFLTDHRYHFPPQAALYRAVRHIWMNAPSPAEEYRFVQEHRPEYVLVGAFGRWVGMYPPALLAGDYVLAHEQDGYQLFRRSRP